MSDLPDAAITAATEACAKVHDKWFHSMPVADAACAAIAARAAATASLDRAERLIEDIRERRGPFGHLYDEACAVGAAAERARIRDHLRNVVASRARQGNDLVLGALLEAIRDLDTPEPPEGQRT